MANGRALHRTVAVMVLVALALPALVFAARDDADAAILYRSTAPTVLTGTATASTGTVQWQAPATGVATIVAFFPTRVIGIDGGTPYSIGSTGFADVQSGLTYTISYQYQDPLPGTYNLAVQVDEVPPNNALVNAEALTTDSGTTTGTTRASTLGNDPVPTADTQRTVWYRWTPSVSGVVDFVTEVDSLRVGGTFPPAHGITSVGVAVYDHATNNLLATQGDGEAHQDGGGSAGAVRGLPVTAGVRYDIAVFSAGGTGVFASDPAAYISSGSFNLQWSLNARPRAVDDEVTTDSDTAVTIDVLANDTDVDGDPLSVSAFDATSILNGTVSRHGSDPNVLVYEPPSGAANVVDRFTYDIDDGHGNVASATVTVYVGIPVPPPSPIVITPGVLDFGAVPLGKIATRTVTITNVSSSPVGPFLQILDQLEPFAFDGSDPSGCALSFTVLQPGDSCTQAVKFWAVQAGTSPGLAQLNFYEAPTSTYLGLAILRASVGPAAPPTPNASPIARDDVIASASGSNPTLEPLDNDSDPDNDVIRITSAADPPHGSVLAVVRCADVVSGQMVSPPADCIRYQPDPGFVGVDTIDYTISDGRGGSASAVFFVNVDNAAPFTSIIFPDRGLEGVAQDVVVQGDNFSAYSTLTFLCNGNAVPATITSLTTTEIHATAPALPLGTCDVEVLDVFGSGSALSGGYSVVVPSADLEAINTSPVDPDVGVSNTFVLKVVNHGPDTTVATTLTDTIASAFTVQSTDAPLGATCTVNAGQVVSCAFGDVVRGDERTVTVHVTPVATGFVQNELFVASGTAEPPSEQWSNVATVDILVGPHADLEAQKTGPPVATMGSPTTFGLAVTNHGPRAASGITLSDTVPAAFTIQSVDAPTGATCGWSGQDVTCTIATLASQRSATVTVHVTPITAGPYTNTLTVSSPTPEPPVAPFPNDATVSGDVVTAADLEAQKTGPGVVEVAASATFTLRAVNHGPSSASGVTLHDTVPAAFTIGSIDAPPGVNCGTSGQVVTCTAGDLAVGDSAAVTVHVTANTTGAYTNTVTVTSSTPEPAVEQFTNSASASGAVTPPPNVPPETTITSSPPNPTSSRDATFAFESDPGAFRRFRCSLDGDSPVLCTSPVSYHQLADGLHHYSVFAESGAGLFDLTPATYDWSVVPLEITVSVSANPTHVSEPFGFVEFTVTVHNASDEPVVTTSLTDDVYGNLAGQGTCATSQLIAPGAHSTCSFGRVVGGDAGSSHTDTVTASALGASTVGVATATGSATVTVDDVLPSIEVTRLAPAQLPFGTPAGFTVAVRNLSPEVLTLDALVDDVYGDLDGQGTCSANVTIDSNTTYTCVFTAPVTGDAGTVQTDTVAATVSDNEGNHLTRSAAATVEVVPVVTATTAAVQGAGTSVVGQPYTVTWTVAGVTNPGPVESATVTVTGGSGCSAPVEAGSCTVSSPHAGTQALHVAYLGTVNYLGSAADTSHVVLPASTDTTITSVSPTTTVVGQPYAVHWFVSVNAPGAGTPTGQVTVSDGAASCSANATVGSCVLASSGVGTKPLVATYDGDGDFEPSVSPSVDHQVGPATTATSITSIAPARTAVNQQYAVHWAVAPVAPGSGVPTGTVEVSDGTNVCSAPLPADSCSLASTSVGLQTITATFVPGDANFTASGTSATHRVDAVAVSSLSPNALARGVANRTVEVFGGGFVAGTRVTVLGGGVTVRAQVVVVDEFHLTVTVSVAGNATLGPRDVQVALPGRNGATATCTGCFTVDLPPALTSVTPNAVPQGTTLDLRLVGSEFQGGAQVSFAGTGIQVNSVTASPTLLTANVTIGPAAATGNRNVTVTNPDGGTVTKSGLFVVNAWPTITSVTPNSRARGVSANIVILGSGYAATFLTGGTVSFGTGISIGIVTRNSASKLTVAVVVDPAAPLGSRDVSVTNPDGGSVTCAGCFIVTAPPTVSPPISPNALPRGASQVPIAVTGNGFQSGASATVSGTGVTVNSTTVNSPTSLTLKVTVGGGAATGTRDVVFTNPDGGSVTCTACLTVNPLPTISSVTPGSGARGASHLIVTVTGTGYQPGALVTIGGNGIVIHSSTVNNAGSITIDLSIAATAPTGNRSVTVTNPENGQVTRNNAFRVA